MPTASPGEDTRAGRGTRLSHVVVTLPTRVSYSHRVSVSLAHRQRSSIWGTLNIKIALSSPEPASETERDAQPKMQAQRVASESPTPPPDARQREVGGGFGRAEENPARRLRGLEKAASPQAEQRMRRRPLVLRHGRGARGHRGLEPAAQQLRLACLLPRLRAQPPSAEKSDPPIPSVHSSSFPTISRTMRVSPAKWGAVSTTSGPSGRALPGPPWSERALVPSVGRVSIPSPATAPSKRGLYGSPPAQQRTASPLSPGDTRERPLAGV